MNRIHATAYPALRAEFGESEQKRLFTPTNPVVNDDPDATLARCNEHIAFAGNHTFPFMLRPYRNLRSLLFNVCQHAVAEVKFCSIPVAASER